MKIFKILLFFVVSVIFSSSVYAITQEDIINNLTQQGFNIIKQDYDCFIAEKNNKQGAFDQNGNMAVPPSFDNVEVKKDNERNMFYNAFIVTAGNKKGAYVHIRETDTYTLAVPLAFDDIDTYSSDSEYMYLIVKNSLNKKGLYAISHMRNFQFTLPIAYDEIKFENDIIKVKQFGKWGAFRGDKQLAPAMYDEIDVDGSALIVTQSNYKGAYYDGILIIPIVYDEIKYALNNNNVQIDTYIIKKNNKFGVVGYKINYHDSETKLINFIPTEYDEIESVYRGFIVKKNGKYGLYHITKGQLLKPKYDKIYLKNDNQACIYYELNGEEKTIDMNDMSAGEKTESTLFNIIFFPILLPLKGLH